MSKHKDDKYSDAGIDICYRKNVDTSTSRKKKLIKDEDPLTMKIEAAQKMREDTNMDNDILVPQEIKDSVERINREDHDCEQYSKIGNLYWTMNEFLEEHGIHNLILQKLNIPKLDEYVNWVLNE